MGDIVPFKKETKGPKWKVYHFLSGRRESVINRWLRRERIDKTQRAKFQVKIDLLERGGPEMVPGLIVGPVAKDVFKMKIKAGRGQVQLRPHLCEGPFGDREHTLLAGAVEKDGELSPGDVEKRAQTNRAILLSDSRRRRRERVKGAP